MYDLDKPAEIDFLRLLREFGQKATSESFTNRDFVALAEKHAGQELDWFFRQWLFNRGIPEYTVKWSTDQRDDGTYVVADVITERVNDDYSMPVWVQIKTADERASFYHPAITGIYDTFAVGPFDSEPVNLVFNEFYSVLCKSHVDKR
jgi:aminopeptidase N